MPKFDNQKMMKIHESRLKDTVVLLEQNLIMMDALREKLANLRKSIHRDHPKTQSEIDKIRNTLANLQIDRNNDIKNRKQHYIFFLRYKSLWLAEE